MIRLTGRGQTMHAAGTRLYVTDSDVAARLNIFMVTSKRARDLVDSGAAEWVSVRPTM